MVWTPEKIQLLQEQWEAGLSITQIGKNLGMTRNAVVGKAHRMGLNKRPSPILRGENSALSAPRLAPQAPRKKLADAAPKTAQARSEKPAAPSGPSRNGLAQVAAALSAAIPVSKTATCKWPIGDPRKPDFHFCEAPALEGKPYCAQHCALAFTGWDVKETEAA